MDIDPLLVFIKVDVAKTVLLDDWELFVLLFSEVGIDDYGAVVAGVNEVFLVTVFEQGADDALELPRGGRGGGEEEVPGDVDFESGVFFLVNHVLVTGKIHEAIVITENGFGTSGKDGDGGFGHGSNFSMDIN